MIANHGIRHSCCRYGLIFALLLFAAPVVSAAEDAPDLAASLQQLQATAASRHVTLSKLSVHWHMATADKPAHCKVSAGVSPPDPANSVETVDIAAGAASCVAAADMIERGIKQLSN